MAKVYTEGVTGETGHMAGRDVSGAPATPAKEPQRVYRCPELTVYGQVADLTLGGSPGIGDSGAGTFTHNPFGGGP